MTQTFHYPWWSTKPSLQCFSGNTYLGHALSTTACSASLLGRTHAGRLAATGHTRAKGVQNTPNELSRAQTPLRHAQLGNPTWNLAAMGHTLTTRSAWKPKLCHSDKAWVSKLLTAIKIDVRIGHPGPRHYTHARNLSSAFQHPEVIDQELTKECDAGRILGPFTTSLIYPLHC